MECNLSHWLYAMLVGLGRTCAAGRTVAARRVGSQRLSLRALWLFVGQSIAHNVSHIAEGGEYEALTFKFKQMLNRSTTVDISTKPPLLAMCCYMLCFSNFK